MQEEIKGLRADVDKLDVRLTSLEGEVVGLKTEVSDLRDEVADIKEDTEITRAACNELVEWAEKASVVINVPFLRAVNG